MKNEILTRFLSYVAIDTQSDDTSTTFPSTVKQFDMLNLLHEQLKAFGLADVSIDSNGYVMGTLPSNTAKKVPVIGFVSHVDTSPDSKYKAQIGRELRWEKYRSEPGEEYCDDNNRFSRTERLPGANTYCY